LGHAFLYRDCFTDNGVDFQLNRSAQQKVSGQILACFLFGQINRKRPYRALFSVSRGHPLWKEILCDRLERRLLWASDSEKSIRLAKGVCLNLGKKGTSLSVDGHGLTTTISEGGVKETFSIPGARIS
jgi:hypothetical protein